MKRKRPKGLPRAAQNRTKTFSYKAPLHPQGDDTSMKWLEENVHNLTSQSDITGSTLIDRALAPMGTNYLGQKNACLHAWYDCFLLTVCRIIIYDLTLSRAKRKNIFVSSNRASRGACTTFYTLELASPALARAHMWNPQTKQSYHTYYEHAWAIY